MSPSITSRNTLASINQRVITQYYQTYFYVSLNHVLLRSNLNWEETSKTIRPCVILYSAHVTWIYHSITLNLHCVCKTWIWISLSLTCFLRSIMQILIVHIRNTNNQHLSTLIEASWVLCGMYITAHPELHIWHYLSSVKKKTTTLRKKTNQSLSFSSWPSSSAATTCFQHKLNYPTLWDLLYHQDIV